MREPNVQRAQRTCAEVASVRQLRREERVRAVARRRVGGRVVRLVVAVGHERRAQPVHVALDRVLVVEAVTPPHRLVAVADVEAVGRRDGRRRRRGRPPTGFRAARRRRRTTCSSGRRRWACPRPASVPGNAHDVQSGIDVGFVSHSCVPRGPTPVESSDRPGSSACARPSRTAAVAHIGSLHESSSSVSCTIATSESGRRKS